MARLRSRSTARDKHGRSLQNDPKFGELTGLRINLNRAAMLLDDDVVTNGQAQSGPFAGRLCREEGVEQLLLHLGGYTGAIVAYLDFDTVAEVLGRGSQRWVKGPLQGDIETLLLGPCPVIRVGSPRPRH